MFSESHSQGRPFFTLTQNALSDSAYANYLREMYGDKIHLPDADDTTRCMEEYRKDAGSASWSILNFQKYPYAPAIRGVGRSAKDDRQSRETRRGGSDEHSLAVDETHSGDQPEQGIFVAKKAMNWRRLTLWRPHEFVFKIKSTTNENIAGALRVLLLTLKATCKRLMVPGICYFHLTPSQELHQFRDDRTCVCWYRIDSKQATGDFISCRSQSGYSQEQ